MPHLLFAWLYATFVIVSLSNEGSNDITQPGLQYHYSIGSTEYFQVAGRSNKVINMTDSVYKCALRFLRCSRTPDNPHGIALLDPLDFSWDRLAHKRTMRLDGFIDGTAHNLSQVEINHVRVIVPSGYAKFECTLPRLYVYGLYNVTGILANSLPVFGSGPYSIELSNVSLDVTLQLGMNSSGNFYVSIFEFDFSPAYTQVYLGDILGGGPLGAVMQDFLQDSAQQLVVRIRPYIQEQVKSVAVASANSLLSGFKNVNDILVFLITFGNVTNSC